MSDLNKVVPKVDYKVNVRHTIAVKPLNFSTNFFSEVNPFFSNSKREGTAVYCFHSLMSLKERLNNITQTSSKSNSIALLKGLYNLGTSGSYCYKTAPFLFFDIDVKEKENNHLFEPSLNAEVFTKLREISVLVWRSNSGKGIAGVLYVPKIADYTHKDSNLHLKTAKAITDYLKRNLGVNADFDNSQSKFRQLRYLTKQTEKRELNLNPYIFDYSVKQEQAVSVNNTPKFFYSNNKAVKGSIMNKFNNSTSIETALLDNGFIKLNDNRYIHQRTSSKSTGATSNNLFFNHSTNFSNYKVFTPFWLYYTEKHQYNLKALLSELKQKGYYDDEPTIEAFKQAENKLKRKAEDRTKQIFDACYDLQNGTYKQRVLFADSNAKNYNEKILFYDYLKLKFLEIEYNKTLTINNYVSEQIETILNYSDSNKKILVCADTGTGKTTAFLKEFKNKRPNQKLLILAPLTAIVEQLKAQNPDALCLTGTSTAEEHVKVKNNDCVIATYEQGTKYLSKQLFDYVVIDEAHNLISANSYKYEAIKELTKQLNDIKVIGLTGTANTLFKQIGFKLLRVKKQHSKKTQVTFRTDNRQVLNIVKDHLKQVKEKCIFRFNSIKIAEALKKTLVKERNYKANEILVLNSTDTVKYGKDFKQLSCKSKFENNIKIVFTTSLIDEGLSIKQNGFTDVVFIETEYNPKPEAFKQFIARFRNEDINRNYFYYYKEVKNQNIKSISINYLYNNLKSEVIEYAKERGTSNVNKPNSSGYDLLLYADNSLNKYALANEVNNEFFKCLTTQEYIHFIELNYNLIINKCDNYLKEQNDNSIEITSVNDKKQKIAKYWVKYNFEVLNVLRELTKNKSVKNSIEYTGYKPEDKFYTIVNENKKAFETLVLKNVELLALGENEPNNVLIKDNKLADAQTVNRKITLLQNLDVINQPKTKQDIKNSKKIKNFVAEVSKLDSFKTNELFKFWKKQRCNSLNLKGYNLTDLINHFHNYKEDRKTRTFYKV